MYENVKKNGYREFDPSGTLRLSNLFNLSFEYRSFSNKLNGKQPYSIPSLLTFLQCAMRSVWFSVRISWALSCLHYGNC